MMGSPTWQEHVVRKEIAALLRVDPERLEIVPTPAGGYSVRLDGREVLLRQDDADRIWAEVA